MKNIDVSKILDKEMDRTQFLKNVGIGAVAFVGLTAVFNVFDQGEAPKVTSLNENSQSAGSSVAMTYGYGGSAYGR